MKARQSDQLVLLPAPSIFRLWCNYRPLETPPSRHQFPAACGMHVLRLSLLRPHRAERPLEEHRRSPPTLRIYVSVGILLTLLGNETPQTRDRRQVGIRIP